MACEALAEVGRWLGEGIADLADVLDPEVVVIGGGVSQAGDLLLDPARQAYAEHLTGAGHRPRLRIVSEALGIDAGLRGERLSLEQFVAIANHCSARAQN